MKPEKEERVSRAAALSEINKYHLMFAGYSDADIVGLGKLDKLTRDRMSELIRRKVMEEAAKGFLKNGRETKPFHEPDKKQ